MQPATPSGALAPSTSAHTPRRGFLRSLRWALAGAVCAGSVWAVVLLTLRLLFDASFLPIDVPNELLELAVIYGVFGEVYGLLAGSLLGYFRARKKAAASALALGFGCGFFGALGGSLSVLAVAAAGPRVDPILSSSLVWSAVGFAMGLYGYLWSRQTSDDNNTFPQAPTEQKRRWRTRALGRVLPILVVSAGSLVTAAIYALSDLSVALLAVGLLGLSVAIVLCNQDTPASRTP